MLTVLGTQTFSVMFAGWLISFAANVANSPRFALTCMRANRYVRVTGAGGATIRIVDKCQTQVKINSRLRPRYNLPWAHPCLMLDTRPHAPLSFTIISRPSSNRLAPWAGGQAELHLK